jgi:predicted ATP-grasp superfamily ATP-dependent carboligase
MKDKLSVLIPDGEDDSIPLAVLRCLAQAPGLKINVLASKRWAPIRFSRFRAGFFNHNKISFDRERLDVILQTAKKSKADIILPVEQATIRLIAKHREEVESIAALPPIPTPELIDAVSDKWLLAEILERENIPHPATILYQRSKSYEQDVESLSFPVLVKPLDGFGGDGIIYFNELPELTEYLKNGRHSDRFIIQSFIRGYDIDCSVLCQNGEILAYTIQKGLLPGKKRFEPAVSIEFLYDKQVYDVIQRLMCNLNWSGVAHIDLRYDETDNKPKIIEVNPRYWGSLAGSLVAGINFPHLACLTSVKIAFPKPEYQFIRFSRLGVSFRESFFVKRLVKKQLNGDNSPHTFSANGLSFILSDPFPELYKQFKKISESMIQRTQNKIE